MRLFTRLRKDERGMTFVFVGMGFMAFLATTMLAVDVGMFMTARSQAQNAADAGALSGAVSMVFDSYTNRSADGPVVQSAIVAAKANTVMAKTVSVTPDDVTFPVDEAGEPSRIKVVVHRTAARSNPVSTILASIFGTNSGDIAASAIAEVAPANAMTCVKPFTIPDKWIEAQTPPWSSDDEYDAYDKKGKLLAKPDIYIPAADEKGNPNPDYTGYNNERERGERLAIRAGTGTNITVSFYFSIAIAGVTGGAEYDWNIANCNQHVMEWGELLTQEPGNMVGPTTSGAELLVAKDPGARWDEGSKKVVNSAFPGQSPRVFPIPLYDPIYYDSGKRNGRFADLKVANWIGFFLEEIDGNTLWGRIIPITGIVKSGAPSPSGLFPKAIRLVG